MAMPDLPAPSGPPSPMGQPHERKGARWMVPLLVVSGGINVVLLALVIALAVGSGSDASEAGSTDGSESEKSATMTVSGTITLTDSGVDEVDGECWGTGGYDDMQGGTQVVVRDADGKTIGAGSLDAGYSDGSVVCVFPFNIHDVPAESSLYSVEVAHRGQITFTEDNAGELSLSLG